MKDNGLLPYISEKAGVYCITIDDYIGYIGQSKNIYNRCCTHICNIQNAMPSKDKRYELLLAAQLGGHKIEFYILYICKQSELLSVEEECIGRYMPPLNIRTPDGNMLLPNTIEDLLVSLHYKIVFDNGVPKWISDQHYGLLPYQNTYYKNYIKMLQEMVLHDYTCGLSNMTNEQIREAFDAHFNFTNDVFKEYIEPYIKNSEAN